MVTFDEEKVALLIDPSRGDGGTLFVQSAAVVPPAQQDPNAKRRLAAAHRLTTRVVRRSFRRWCWPSSTDNRIVRMLQAGEAVKMTVDLSVAWQDQDLMGYNTVAEIPGTDLKDEVVMLARPT